MLLSILLLKRILRIINKLLFIAHLWFRLIPFLHRTLFNNITSVLLVHTKQHSSHWGQLSVVFQIIINITIFSDQINLGKDIYSWKFQIDLLRRRLITIPLWLEMKVLLIWTLQGWNSRKSQLDSQQWAN